MSAHLMSAQLWWVIEQAHRAVAGIGIHAG
jgi:hypothetical protein